MEAERVPGVGANQIGILCFGKRSRQGQGGGRLGSEDIVGVLIDDWQLGQVHQ